MSKSPVLEASVTSTAKLLPNFFELVDSLAVDFATRAATYDRDSSFPFENFDALHKAGLLSLTVPVDLVLRDIPGVKIVETWDHLGMRATGSHDLILKDVYIPTEYALDVRPLKAWSQPDPLMLAAGSLFLSALYQGVATAARDWLVDYLNERSPTNLGASLATLPRFQISISEIEALLYANHQLIYSLAADIDKDEHEPNINLQAQTVKCLATTNAIKAV